jgi:hypothetical protein
MRKFETFLPIFPGFYGTLLEADEDRVMPEEATSTDDYNFDYDKYYQDASKTSCDFIEEVLNDLGFKCKITFQKLVSPREYNFKNDSVNIEILFQRPKAIDEYLYSHQEQLQQYLRDNYTGCDGYIPWHSKDTNDWIKKWRTDAHKIGSILKFIIGEEYQGSDIQMNLYEYVNERVYLDCWPKEEEEV